MMPNECITIQCGQCGNQIGYKFWDLALQEHATCNSSASFDSALSSFFHNVDTRFKPPQELPVGDGNFPIQSLKARAILIDMEEGVVNRISKGHLSDLFDKRQHIIGNSGSGNNWAHGHNFYGPKYHDSILDKIRVEVESCDSLQSFLMLHSLGGGTGSGLGSYILEQLHDEYPKVFRFCASIFPSPDDDVITSPYNSLLSTVMLAEHADCVIPIENQALMDISERQKLLDLRGQVGKHTISSTSREKLKKRGEKPFDEINGIVANLLLHLTSSMRFEGSLNGGSLVECVGLQDPCCNVDLNDITTNLVPFPRLHFLVSSMAPLSNPSYSEPQRLMNRSRSIHEIFKEVFSWENQIIKANPTSFSYLACALLMRGKLCNISDLSQNVSRMQNRLRMIHWNTEGFKVGLCNQSGLESPYSLMCLANNTCIGNRFVEMKLNFDKLYKRKLYLHHYAQYMDLEIFDDSSRQFDELITEYADLEVAGPLDDICHFQPILANI